MVDSPLNSCITSRGHLTKKAFILGLRVSTTAVPLGVIALGTTTAAKVKLSSRTRKAISSRDAGSTASSAVTDSVDDISSMLTDSSSSATLGALFRLSDAARKHTLEAALGLLGIPKVSDAPASQIVGALTNAALSASIAGPSMGANLVARAAAQTFLEIVNARKVSPSKLTLSLIEEKLGDTMASTVVSIFVERLLSNTVGFSIGRIVSASTGSDLPFKDRKMANEFENQVRAESIQHINRITNEVMVKLGISESERISQSKLKKLLQETAQVVVGGGVT